MTEIVKLQQGTKEWLDWRLNGITATEAAKVVCPCKYGTPITVWRDKLNPKQDEQTDAQHWGSILEKDIRNEFAERHKEFEVVQGECYRDEWRLCSLDGELKQDGKTVAILEIKTGQTIEKWDPVPELYYAQVQWQMHVTGIHKVYFAVLIRGMTYFERVVEHDAKFCKHMECECFVEWQNVLDKVMPKSVPEFDDVETGTICEVANENKDRKESYEISDEEYAAFKILSEKVKELEDKLKQQRSVLTRYLVDYKSLTYHGAKFASIVNSKGRDTVDAKLLKEKYPDIYAEVLKTGAPYSYPKFG